MKPLMIPGIVLIVLGVVGLTVQGFKHTTRKKLIDIGDLEITTETQSYT